MANVAAFPEEEAEEDADDGDGASSEAEPGVRPEQVLVDVVADEEATLKDLDARAPGARERAYATLRRAEKGCRLAAEDVARWSAAKRDRKGKAQMHFLREWALGRVHIQPVLRERVTRSHTRSSEQTWIYANRQELMVALAGYSAPEAAAYVDALLRAATTSRRHPMGSSLERQWLVHLTSREVTKVKRSIEQELSSGDMAVDRADAPKVVDAMSRPLGGNGGDSDGEERPKKAARRGGSSARSSAASDAPAPSGARGGAASSSGAPPAKAKAKAKAPSCAGPKAKAKAAAGRPGVANARRRIGQLLSQLQLDLSRCTEAADSGNPVAQANLPVFQATQDMLEAAASELDTADCDLDELKRKLDKISLRVRQHKKTLFDLE